MKKQSEDNIKSILFVAWFIVTFVCAFAFSGSAYSELFIFGQAFFIFGLVAILSMDDISREDYLLFLFLLVGFTLIEISIVGMTKAEYLIKMIPSIITNSIILFGLLIIMFEIIRMICKFESKDIIKNVGLQLVRAFIDSVFIGYAKGLMEY